MLPRCHHACHISPASLLPHLARRIHNQTRNTPFTHFPIVVSGLRVDGPLNLESNLTLKRRLSGFWFDMARTQPRSSSGVSLLEREQPRSAYQNLLYRRVEQQSSHALLACSSRRHSSTFVPCSLHCILRSFYHTDTWHHFCDRLGIPKQL